MESKPKFISREEFEKPAFLIQIFPEELLL
jgi:hypothetical protein